MVEGTISEPAECCTLELLATVKRITELQKSYVILCHVIHQMTSCVDLTKCKLVVVFVVQNVDKVGVEGVNVL